MANMRVAEMQVGYLISTDASILSLWAILNRSESGERIVSEINLVKKLRLLQMK